MSIWHRINKCRKQSSPVQSHPSWENMDRVKRKNDDDDDDNDDIRDKTTEIIFS